MLIFYEIHRNLPFKYDAIFRGKIMLLIGGMWLGKLILCYIGENSELDCHDLDEYSLTTFKIRNKI